MVEPIKKMVAFGSIKILVPPLSIWSKFLKFNELAKSNLYE